MATMENAARPLNKKERRLLSAALGWRKRRKRALPRRAFLGGLLLFGVFWGVIVIARVADKRGPKWYQSGLIALAIVLPISLWSYLGARPKVVADVQLFESALRRNEAHVTRIRSDAMVEFEEEEDEGACYAFQIDHGRIVFVSGQDFYPSANFPNADFSLINIYSDDEILATSLIEKNGAKLKPVRKISSRLKSRLEVPAHLEVIEGDLSRVEVILSSKRQLV